MADDTDRLDRLGRHLAEHFSGRRQQAQFDAMTSSQRRRQWVASWAIITLGFAAAGAHFIQGTPQRLAWLPVEALAAGLLTWAGARYAVRKSEERQRAAGRPGG